MSDPGFREGVDRKSREDDDSKRDEPRYDRNGRDEENPREGDRDREKPPWLRDRDAEPPENSNDERFDRLNDGSRPGAADDLLDDFDSESGRGGRSLPFDDRGDGADIGIPDRHEIGDTPLDRNVRKPEPEEPIDDSETSDDDVVVPPDDSEEAIQARLFRGVLSEAQARTGPAAATSAFRLANQTRRRQQSGSARQSGRDSKQQRPLKWIAAPPLDGRVRL